MYFNRDLTFISWIHMKKKEEEKKVLLLAFEKPQLLRAILNRLARGSEAQSWKALLGPIPRLRAALSLISSHSMPLPWGQGCTSRVSQGQDKPPCAWNHNPPTWARTAGKLLTINKHRCAIIMGCLLRYQDGLSSSICQFKNIVDRPRRTQTHCGVWIEYRGPWRHCRARLPCGIRPSGHVSVHSWQTLGWKSCTASRCIVQAPKTNKTRDYNVLWFPQLMGREEVC